MSTIMFSKFWVFLENLWNREWLDGPPELAACVRSKGWPLEGNLLSNFVGRGLILLVPVSGLSGLFFFLLYFFNSAIPLLDFMQ